MHPRIGLNSLSVVFALIVLKKHLQSSNRVREDIGWFGLIWFGRELVGSSSSTSTSTTTFASHASSSCSYCTLCDISYRKL